MVQWNGRPQSENVINLSKLTKEAAVDPIGQLIDSYSFPTDDDTNSFLLDSFKRAREVGFKDPRYTFTKDK